MAGLLLVASLAGERIAFSATEVESVVEIGDLTPVPGAAGHVAGLSALRSRVLTAIDCRAALAAGERIERPRDALVVMRDGHAYALLVDGVEDVVEAAGPVTPAPPGLASAWCRVAAGHAPYAGGLLLLLSIDALIAGPRPAAPPFNRTLTNCA
jgi:purine-binding chemotaxis protein CheW